MASQDAAMVQRDYNTKIPDYNKVENHQPLSLPTAYHRRCRRPTTAVYPPFRNMSQINMDNAMTSVNNAPVIHMNGLITEVTGDIIGVTINEKENAFPIKENATITTVTNDIVAEMDIDDSWVPISSIVDSRNFIKQVIVFENHNEEEMEIDNKRVPIVSNYDLAKTSEQAIVGDNHNQEVAPVRP